MVDDLPAALRHWRPLFRSRAFGMHEAGDIEGETALRVLTQARAGKTFRDVRGLVGFLGFQVLSNLHRKRVAVLHESDMDEDPDGYDKGDGGRADPHDACASDEAIHAVRDALARVDDKTRTVIFACYWSGRPVSRKDHRFKWAVHRAREKVREAMVGATP